MAARPRDFVYVADVVEHLLAAMACLQTQGGSEVRNVCTGRATTVAALAALLGDLHGAAAGIVAAPARLGDIRHSRGDPVRTAALLGLRADTELRAGLQRLLRSAP